MTYIPTITHKKKKKKTTTISETHDLEYLTLGDLIIRELP